MKVGDLVRCIEGACMTVDAGIGIVIQVEEYDPDKLSIHVQWSADSLWYEKKDLEVVSEKLDR
jgi:hypothetical protein